MTNLTEQEGLRKLLSIEQFNRQAHIPHESGIVGRLVKWLIGGSKSPEDGKVPRKFSDLDVQIIREIEVGTEVSIQREEWDDYRVMIVDQRLRVHPISGINALTQEMEQITLDINIAYKVFDVNYVAFGSDDPLAFLQNRVIETALSFAGNLPLRETSRNGKDIAWEIKQLGRVVECGLEVIDARVSVILPHELIDKMTRTNRILQDAEAMILEKETNARVQERVSKIDFDSELRTIQNQQSIEKVKELYNWDREGNVVDHDIDINRRKNDARRRDEYDDAKHKLSIIQMKFKAFTDMLSSVGMNPKMTIMMMDGDNWQRFFDRFQRLTGTGEDHRSSELKSIHEHINNLITSKQLTEDNIQKLLGYFEEEIKYLGNNTPIMKQFESFLERYDSAEENLVDSGKSEENVQKLLGLSEEESSPIKKQFENFLESPSSSEKKSQSSEPNEKDFSASDEKDKNSRTDNSSKDILGKQQNNKNELDEIKPSLNNKPIEVGKDTEFKISVAHPRLLSKRFESSFLFQVYAAESRTQTARNIKLEFSDQLISEHIKRSSIKHNQKIMVKFFSPQFDFSDPVTKHIGKSLNKIVFLGKPKDECEPGLHKILVSVIDADNKEEFESLTLNVQVVDFAFDHISRPLLSRVSAIMLGVGSFAMFALSFLEQIDKTIGLTSGTAAGVLAVAIYANFYNLYQRVRAISP